ncbi:MAG: hypothetical protein EZS28_010877 [Streblomastix strix]|uniref:Bardet-Biedl syndrome 2 protein n=1 Tax=Streblomastix strix TaxID=222440 RepID=A0A5J4WH31_9EUKA|nr:MAG: hypothetical protein EZS28_010877 [Streblomastix strix]
MEVRHDEEAENRADSRTLSINGHVTGLQAGRLSKESHRDYLAIGLETSLRAYDVVLNSDAFFVHVNEGVNCIALHSSNEGDELQVYAAGNGAVRGYNYKGNEVSWLLAGEDVTAMCPYKSEHGDVGLLIATANSRIQFFKRDEAIFAISETEEILSLTSLAQGVFAYTLASNTVGVYLGTSPGWRHTYPHSVASIQAFDCDGDGDNEVIIGLSDGSLEARRMMNGEILSSGKMEDNIVAMVRWQTSITDIPRLAICTRDGVVKGYRPSQIALPALPAVVRQALQISTLDKKSAIPLDSNVQEMVTYLSDKKVQLEKQITEMEDILKQAKNKSVESNSIPPDTTVRLFCKTNEQMKRLEAHCSTNNEVLIKGILFLSDILYKTGSHFLYADPPSTSVHIPINPPKCKPLQIDAKVIAGTRNISDSYHVFDARLTLKRFPLHVCVAQQFEIESYCSFVLQDRIERVALWLSSAFPLVVKDTHITEMSVNFRCFGDENDPLSFQATSQGDGFIQPGSVQSQGVRVTIRGMKMETVSEVAQDIYDFFKVKDMESVAVFPKEMSEFKDTLKRVVDLNLLRLQLTADIAERTSGAKVAIVKAEDARLMGDLVSMKEWLNNLDAVNKELLKGYLIRQRNHEELLKNLKNVNKVIQWASRLRKGKPQMRVINECRIAISENRIEALHKIIEAGAAESK